MNNTSRYRWTVIIIFFFFMLLHQSDKLLIGPMTTQIMTDFNITKTQMGAVSTGALIVPGLFYPIWGYFYDRYTRAKLLALASLIWGSTTWLNAIAPNYRLFLITRSTTGIDDSSYPGLYSLVSDYFGPGMRGKVYGLLQLTLECYAIPVPAGHLNHGLHALAHYDHRTGYAGQSDYSGLIVREVERIRVSLQHLGMMRKRFGVGRLRWANLSGHSELPGFEYLLEVAACLHCTASFPFF